MTVFSFQQYLNQEDRFPVDQHARLKIYFKLVKTGLQKSAAQLLKCLVALAVVSDPVLWVNLKSGWQQVLAYYQLIKK